MKLALLAVVVLVATGRADAAGTKSAPKSGDVYKCSLSAEQINVHEKGGFKLQTSKEDIVQQVRVLNDALEVTAASPISGVIDTSTYRILSRSAHGTYAILVADLGAVRTASLVDSAGTTVYTETVGTNLPDGVFFQDTMLYVCRKLR
jgi:hypothetical protein